VSAPFAPSAAFRPHRGLYLNAFLGSGEIQVNFANHRISGSTYPLGLAVGLAATNRLVLFGELYEAHAFKALSNREGISTLDLYGFGPGLRYDFMPASMFVSGSMLLSKLSYTGTERSHWGVTGRFSVGKEWWVSPNWSLGVAADVMLGRIDSKTFGSEGLSYEYTVKAFSLLFSSSFNYPSGSPPSAAKPGTLSGDSDPVTAPYESSAGYHTHDGFYLSARLGLGLLRVGLSGATAITGLGYPFALSAGFALTRSIVLFSEFYRASALDPSGGFKVADIVLQGLGPGFKYYLMPKNIFLSSSLLISQITFNHSYLGDYRAGIGSTSSTSPLGITGRISAGKEWWISGDWGLGIAAECLLGRMESMAGGFSLVVSASYN
jgi:hypothetical protein